MKSILLVKKFLGLVEMTSGLVNVSFSLPEWQAVKMIFFTPWYLLFNLPVLLLILWLGSQRSESFCSCLQFNFIKLQKEQDMKELTFAPIALPVEHEKATTTTAY